MANKYALLLLLNGLDEHPNFDTLPLAIQTKLKELYAIWDKISAKDKLLLKKAAAKIATTIK